MAGVLVEDSECGVCKIFVLGFPGREHYDVDLTVGPTAGDEFARAGVLELFGGLDFGTDAFFDGCNWDLGTRVEKGGSLLDRQIPRIAGLFGGGCARRRRRIFSSVRRTAPRSDHADGDHRGRDTSTSPHNLYDGPRRAAVPPTRRLLWRVMFGQLSGCSVRVVGAHGRRSSQPATASGWGSAVIGAGRCRAAGSRQIGGTVRDTRPSYWAAEERNRHVERSDR